MDARLLKYSTRSQTQLGFAPEKKCINNLDKLASNGIIKKPKGYLSSSLEKTLQFNLKKQYFELF